MAFPVSKSRTANVDYITANVAALTHDVDEPDDADAPEETEADAAA